jgi:large subunit ribosomal protein L10
MVQAAVQPKKAEQVQELGRKLAQSRVVGLAKITGIPAPQMQKIRSMLRGKAELRVVKNRLLKRALELASREREGIEGLEDLIEGQVALVLTDSNPFKLFRQLEATKTKAPARGGEAAPEDIMVKEGDTPFRPGPVVGDLQKAGIPAAIEGGKVVIKRDTVLVRKGERIPREVAQVLTRLEIFPITVGLDLRGVYEDGHIFTRGVLAVDEEEVRAQMVSAAARAMSLSLAIAFPTSATIPTLLAEAHRRSLSLAVAAHIPEPGALPVILSRAQAQLLSLASRVPEGLDNDLRALVGSRPEPPKEEAPREEKKEDEDEEEEAAAGLSSLFG